MPSKTFAELQTEVQVLTKVTNASDQIKNAINRAYYELSRAEPLDEFLTLLTVAGSGFAAGVYTLPADFIKEHRIKFTATASASESWYLTQESLVVMPATIPLKPDCYQVIGDPANATQNYKLTLSPFAGIVAGDSILIEYFKVPTLLSASSDKLPTTRWEQRIVKRAAYFTFVYFNKMSEAEALMNNPSPTKSNDTPATT